ncbi:uncharacterized protein PADG_08471 [Paracoccidioides brasiliensis Pb18]|uniref:Uncharacterized protein n=1 Tax=Paracoccidioides brasiliensis (strain Pb18) TaxID=502780 RepID=C1GMI5_PARBD|nr:uncharacterized protein PADG_08471 [Paracoccidioides brasiliensis Pb18]EEH43651.1 hypothetical protein PADG_08471 [Paracoccidioides brasiliensis Pb18]
METVKTFSTSRGSSPSPPKAPLDHKFPSRTPEARLPSDDPSSTSPSLSPVPSSTEAFDAPGETPNEEVLPVPPRFTVVSDPVSTSTVANSAFPSPYSAASGHNNFKQIVIHTAKCDKCNDHNKATLNRCTTCGFQICTPCWIRRGGGHHTGTRTFTGPVFDPNAVDDSIGDDEGDVDEHGSEEDEVMMSDTSNDVGDGDGGMVITTDNTESGDDESVVSLPGKPCIGTRSATRRSVSLSSSLAPNSSTADYKEFSDPTHVEDGIDNDGGRNNDGVVFLGSRPLNHNAGNDNYHNYNRYYCDLTGDARQRIDALIVTASVLFRDMDSNRTMVEVSALSSPLTPPLNAPYTNQTRSNRLSPPPTQNRGQGLLLQSQRTLPPLPLFVLIGPDDHLIPACNGHRSHQPIQPSYLTDIFRDPLPPTLRISHVREDRGYSTNLPASRSSNSTSP